MAENEAKSVLKEFEELLQSLHRAFFASGPKQFGALDVTLQQFIMMNVVRDLGLPMMSDLARELDVTLGNMTAMVERLNKQGYVARTSDPEDRRIVHQANSQGQEDR